MSDLCCPYCDAELEYEDSFGNLAFIQGRGEKSGDIFRCPNHEGFSTKEDVENYATKNCMLFIWDLNKWEEIYCDSSVHNVSGSFYTDKNGDLHEGYPC
jgi:hypothetical protein